MNKNMNIAEILKDAPKGTKLWSPMLGDCYFEEYQERESTYPIRVRFINHHKEIDYRNFSIYGKAVEVDSAECVLFPSKENRDWTKFKTPWKHKHFEPYQKVLITIETESKIIWYPAIYAYYNDDKNMHQLLYGGVRKDNEIIPYEGNENKLLKPVEIK